MEPKAYTSLRSDVSSAAEWLNRVLGKALTAEFEPGGEGRALSERGAEALERFWDTALDLGRPLFDSAALHSPGFWSRLYHRFTEGLKTEARPCFAPHLEGLKNGFGDLLVLDGARLHDVAHWLHLKDAEGPLVLPGRLAALYDLCLGFPVRLWFAPVPGSPDPAEHLEREGLERGGLEGGATIQRESLLLGGERYATLEMFERLERLRLHGAFSIGPRTDMRVSLVLGEDRQKDGPIEDVIVEVEEAGRSPRPLRLVLLRATEAHGGKNLGKDLKDCAVLTDVLDPRKLPAPVALRLAAPRWGIERIFSDVAKVVDLERLDGGDPRRLEGQVYRVAFLAASFRVAQGWIAGALGLPAAVLNSELLFTELARVAQRLACRRGERRPPSESGAIVSESCSERNGSDQNGSDQNGSDIIVTLDRGLELGPWKAGLGPLDVAPRRPRPLPATREEMMTINQTVLDPAFEPFTRGYAEVGHRNAFLWRWVQRGIELTTLPSIDLPLRGPNRTVKLLGVMLDVLLDDVADNLKDGEFLSSLLAIPFSRKPLVAPRFSADRTRYYLFTAEVWGEIARLAQSFPRYDELKEVFEFDYRQLLNTMSYAYLVNRLPEILNPTEHDLYQPHNMHMMISGTLDLMCSGGFDKKELAPVRQALWRGQVMGRIGNMVSTWEREIKERDFTSGVFATAIEWGIVRSSDLARMDPVVLTETIDRSGIVEHFLEKWERLRDEVFQIVARVKTIDLASYAAGLEELIRNHLGSRGLK